jgi:hypothetical protein
MNKLLKAIDWALATPCPTCGHRTQTRGCVCDEGCGCDPNWRDKG